MGRVQRFKKEENWARPAFLRKEELAQPPQPMLGRFAAVVSAPVQMVVTTVRSIGGGGNNNSRGTTAHVSSGDSGKVKKLIPDGVEFKSPGLLALD